MKVFAKQEHNSNAVSSVGDLTLASGKRIYFGSTSYYLELLDGVLHTNVGLYSDSFISARGVDSEAGGGGGGTDLDAVWASLMGNTDDYKDDKINVAHVPDIAQSKVTGLAASLSAINTSINDLSDALDTAELALAEAVATAAERLTALEEWAESPTASDMFVDNLDANTINLQGEDITASRITGMESDISANAANISTNTANIAANASAIATNAQGITDLNTALTNHTSNTSNPHSVTKSQVGLGNVENTKLSTWTGSTSIKTLGTITSGTWNGTKIANAYLANSAITVNGTSVSLGGSVTTGSITAGTAGTSSATSGYTLAVPYLTMNAYGIVTAYGTHTHTVKNIPNSSLANSAITVNGTSVSLGGSVNTASITAGTAGTSSATSGYTLSVPYVTMNKYGVVTAYGTHTHTVSGIPNSSLSNSSVTIAGTSVSLGGSIAASTIKSAMSFSALSFSAGTFSSLSSYNTTAARTLYIPTNTSHISESGNLYFTNARAVSACSSTYQTITVVDKDELALAEAAAAVSGRVTALEEWTECPTASDMYTDLLGVSRINVNGTDITSTTAGTVSISGVLYASTGIWSDGYVSARGQDTSSDASLKKDFAPLDDALAYLRGTRYVRFRWRDSGEESVGVIAQEEREREYGFLVRNHEGPGHLTYDYAASTAILGAALQQEDKRVAALEARIKELENEISKLKNI